jgi:hypothetical protein
VADAHVPGVQQTLDDEHLSEHLHAFATLQYPANPAGARAWGEQKLGALLTDRIGAVWSALKQRWPWKKAVCDALARLIGYVERNRNGSSVQRAPPTRCSRLLRRRSACR